MIEKKIHYCWFGKGEKNKIIQKCIASWRSKCPDYELIEWNEDNFDVNANQFCAEAYKEKKWAFVSDYARIWILYHYGGIYFDTDIEVLRNFDKLLENDAFTGFEGMNGTEMVLQTGVIACNKHNPVILKMLRYYEAYSLYAPDGSIRMEPNVIQFTKVFKEMGLVPIDKEQFVAGWRVYPRTYFTPIDPHGNRNITKNSYTDHHFTSTWEEEDKQGLVALRRSLKYRIEKRINIGIKKILGPYVVEKIRGWKNER
ncbi:MAG: glycosyltransferase family 32 protein [Blautia sp.]|uniref:glycosyltransferase family 32 protein n=1 Tax=Blautia sp. TaxID=1955243 RepID=UPI0039952C6B